MSRLGLPSGFGGGWMRLVGLAFLSVLVCQNVGRTQSIAAHDAIQVALFEDAGVGKSAQDLKRVLRSLDGIYYRAVTASQINQGALADFDVLIHPGGSGSKQGRALGQQGRGQVRAFVEAGGGYLGICAGAYLASADYDWSLHLLDAKVVDRQHWARGTGRVDLGLSTQGKAFFGTDEEQVPIHYGQGPLLAPADDPSLPDFEVLASFDSEIAKNGAPSGVMVGTTAIAKGTFGRGRVVCFSPHPELTEGLEAWLGKALEHARRERTAEQGATGYPLQYIKPVDGTSDVSQRGLPNGNYCAPCSVANVLLRFQAEGRLSISEGISDARALALELGDQNYMQTRQRNGTNRYRLVNGMHRWLEERGNALQVRYLGLRDYDLEEVDAAVRPELTATIGVPTLEYLQAELSSGRGVLILFGSYKPNPERDDRLERVGGHYVAAVGYGVNEAGAADSASILLHDSNDGRTGIKFVSARPVTAPVNLYAENQVLADSRRLVQLENAPITQDGRIAYLETVFSFDLP